MSRQNRPLDLVIYGASGFTAGLVCKHLVRYGGRYKLGVAGRSKAKLEAVVARHKLRNVEIFIAEAGDLEALKAMCRRTKVVISAVGPYIMWGDGPVRACAETGTHYFDLTGETVWYKRQVDLWDRAARRSGTVFVPSSGFDSVPSDIGALLAVKELKRVGGPNVEVGAVSNAQRMLGSFSGGTAATLIDSVAAQGLKQNLEVDRDPYFISAVKGKQTAGGASGIVFREPGIWGSKSPFAIHDVPLVLRSWSLLQKASERGNKSVEAYGPSFSFREFLHLTDPISSLLLSIVFGITYLLAVLAPTRWFLRKIAPSSGTGPSKWLQENGWFQSHFTAHSKDRQFAVRVTLRGKGDPGYKWTAATLAESALCIVDDWDRLPPLASEGGFLTPATALGEVLVDRLEKLGILTVDSTTLKGPAKPKRS